MMYRKMDIRIFIGFLCLGITELRAQSSDALMDSTFSTLTLPQLQQIQDYYLKEMDQLDREREYLIERGIDDGERLLVSTTDPDVLDDIIIRLADLYYYQEKNEYMKRMDAFDQQLQNMADTSEPQSSEEPRLNYQKSLQMYQRIIDEYPQSDLMDDAIYNRGFLLEEMEQYKLAMQTYNHLIHAFPDSRYVPEAYMRLGEYYFNPPHNDLNKAITYYKQVGHYKENPRYEEALYKLGWSYYRLSEYPEAISYFTTLIENVTSMRYMTNQTNISRMDLMDEAIEYVAISFIDYGGPQKAFQYLKSLNWPDWSTNVLQKLGRMYKTDKEDYPLAIETFRLLLSVMDNDPGAPFIQQQIVDCYQILGQENETILARQELFENYGPHSTWFQTVEDEKTMLHAYRLAEEALRENFNTMMRRAMQSENQTLFRKSIELGYNYLEHFPEDNYAYMVRWNVALMLDMKLHDYKAALQEYMTISLAYNASEYLEFAREKGMASIKDAAQNAIVMADTLMRREKTAGSAQKDKQSRYMLDGDSLETLQAVPLTEGEKWQLLTYDNYIKLFPYDNNTPTILSNAGVLYFTSNQFDEALRYFKTLKNQFPESRQARDVEMNILESYFRKKDYVSVETLAKKMLADTLSSEIKLRAKQRLSESIFLKAQRLAGSGQSKRAAEEYMRLVLDIPTASFADRALFNAGMEYDRIKAYTEAIRAYEMLFVSCKNSPLFLDAMNNLGFDYFESGDFQNAGIRYHEFSKLIGDSARAEDALYNAYLSFKQGRHFDKAILISREIIQRFPNNMEAGALFFEASGFYALLNESNNAMRQYIEYTALFPNSPLCVEAFYKIADYYLKQDSLALARFYYLKSYQSHALQSTDSLQIRPFIAAEALYHATRLEHSQYEKKAFISSEDITQRFKEKQNQLLKLRDQYTNVIALKTIRLPESLYRVGELYEQFAEDWLNQSRPQLDGAARAVKEKQIHETATQILEEALQGYMTASRGLILFLQASKNGSSAADTTDSLNHLAEMWKIRSEQKISETLYHIAEVNEQSIWQLFDVPAPQDLSDIELLEYKSQLLLKAINPLVDRVVQAHRRNLSVSDSLHLKNDWVGASLRKVFDYLDLLGKRYESLAFEALHDFNRQAEQFEKHVLKSTSPVDPAAIDYMLNLIEVGKSYSLVSLVFHEQAVRRGIELGVMPDSLQNGYNRTDQFALSIFDSTKLLIKMSESRQLMAAALFDSTEDLRYEEGLAAFEDNAFYLKDFLKIFIEKAYSINLDKIRRPYRLQLAVKLLQLDPDKYIKELKLATATIVVPTDTTWMFSTSNSPDDWDLPVFDGRAVLDSVTIDSTRFLGDADRIMAALVHPSPQVKFYKQISVPGLPFSGIIELHSNALSELSVNRNPLNMTENHPLNISQYLQSGLNQIQILCRNQLYYSLTGLVKIDYIEHLEN